MSCGFDITARIGETLSLTIVYKKEDGTPIDIANDSVILTIGLVTYVSPGAELIIGPEPGTIHLMLTTAQVDSFGVTILPYSLKLIDSDVPVGQGDTILLDGLMQFE